MPLMPNSIFVSTADTGAKRRAQSTRPSGRATRLRGHVEELQLLRCHRMTPAVVETQTVRFYFSKKGGTSNMLYVTPAQNILHI